MVNKGAEKLAGSIIASPEGPVCPRSTGKCRGAASGLISALSHSITWSARASTDCGIVSPSAFAGLDVGHESNVVGRPTSMFGGRKSAIEHGLDHDDARLFQVEDLVAEHRPEVGAEQQVQPEGWRRRRGLRRRRSCAEPLERWR